MTAADGDGGAVTGIMPEGLAPGVPEGADAGDQSTPMMAIGMIKVSARTRSKARWEPRTAAMVGR